LWRLGEGAGERAGCERQKILLKRSMVRELISR
jgi:hypothetical protein